MSTPTRFFSAVSCITLILVCIPFPWHMEAWNTGTCLYMFWTALALLSLFINSIVWADNAIDWAPVWCDISSRIIIAVSVAIPAASLCINHRLYVITTLRTTMRTVQEKRRAVLVDLYIGLGLPLMATGLQYIVQGHRYNIFEEIGCYPFTYNTPPAYLLVWGIPLLIGMISAFYSVLSIKELRRRQLEFNEVLSSNSNLSSSRFFRLMALAGVEALCCIPLSIATITLNATRAPVHPWISWQDTHYGFSRVDQIPAMQWRMDPNANIGLEMTRWLVVVCGLVFFAFFGFSEEAQKNYKLAFNSAFNRLGSLSPTGGTITPGSNIRGSTGCSSKWRVACAASIPSLNTRPVTQHNSKKLFPRAVGQGDDCEGSFHDANYKSSNTVWTNSSGSLSTCSPESRTSITHAHSQSPIYHPPRTPRVMSSMPICFTSSSASSSSSFPHFNHNFRGDD